VCVINIRYEYDLSEFDFCTIMQPPRRYALVKDDHYFENTYQIVSQ